MLHNRWSYVCVFGIRSATNTFVYVWADTRSNFWNLVSDTDRKRDKTSTMRWPAYLILFLFITIIIMTILDSFLLPTGNKRNSCPRFLCRRKKVKQHIAGSVVGWVTAIFFFFFLRFDYVWSPILVLNSRMFEFFTPGEKFAEKFISF